MLWAPSWGGQKALWLSLWISTVGRGTLSLSPLAPGLLLDILMEVRPSIGGPGTSGEISCMSGSMKPISSAEMWPP